MKVIACVASGPSLTEADCALLASSGIEAIVVNTSWKMMPSARHLYAGDFQWWQANHEILPSEITRWSSSHATCSRYNARLFESPINGSFNSGQRAILLARKLGADLIILLGYDCSISEGAHWHADHSDGLKNPDARSVMRWRREFSELTQCVPNDIIINCSRHTELSLFKKADLEEQLAACKNILSRG